MAGFRGWLRGLVGKEEPPPSLLSAGTGFSGPRSFGEEGSDFALAMYRQLQQRPRNLFFSPFSIRTALGLLQAGARGETAAQMRAALCISWPEDILHVAFAETIQRLNTGGDNEYEMVVTNSLWAQDGAPPQPEFLDLIARHY